MKIAYSKGLNSSSYTKYFVDGISFLSDFGHNLFAINSAKDSIEKIEKSIKNCDIFIAEISEADAFLGFEVARAISENKVVILMSEDSTKNKSLDKIFKHKNVVLAKYNAKNFKNSLDKALQAAFKKTDSKFILIISQDIERYLNWASKNKRMHKAQIVRNAIENMMKKDTDFKKENGDSF